MTLKIDLHVHTIASGHAYNTIYELIQEAKRKKMRVIGITDHAPEEFNTVNKIYLSNMKLIPKTINGIRVLKGVELDLADNKHNVRLDEVTLNKMDYAILSTHSTIKGIDSNKTNNTEVLISAIKKYPKIKIIGHPYAPYIDFDMVKLTEFACKNNILMEINLSYFQEHRLKKWDINKMKTLISIVRKYNKKVILNSDAHFMTQLGDDSILTPALMKKLGLTKEMIINNYPEELEKVLGVKF